jgi:GAF domain-containing protein
MPADDLRIESQRRRALDETGLLTEPAPPEFHDMCEQARAHFHVPMALVKIITGDKVTVKAQAGIALEELPRHQAFSDHTIRSDKVFVVHDATHDARFLSHPIVARHAIAFYAGAPLIYRRQVRLGSLCLFDTEPREFSLGDRAELANMADELVSVLIRQDMERGSRLFAH